MGIAAELIKETRYVQIPYDWEAGQGLGVQIGLRAPIQFKC